MTGYYTADACRVDDLVALIDETMDPAAVPMAAEVQHNIPIYGAADVDAALQDPQTRLALMAEWGAVLRDHA